MKRLLGVVLGTADSYLAPVVAHDPSRAPISPSAKFVENTVPLKPGDGLWKTASEVPTNFKIYVLDPATGQVGFLGMMKDAGNPIQLGLRLKMQNGKITEMEHLIAGLNTMAVNFNPFDLPAAHVYKIRGGKIHEIESMGFTMPYDSKTGWEEAGK